MTGIDDEAGDTGSRPGRALGKAPREVPDDKPSDTCPICGKSVRAAFRPFCSQRCADVDLGRWLGERYVIPGPESDDENGHA